LNPQTQFAGETAINVPSIDTGWKVRGLLRNTMQVIY
jgi:hypothetical protein